MCASLFVASAFASPIAFSIGEVATIYPSGATDEQKRTNKCARVEIFKMTGGTEYIVHDIDVNNIIVGKARFSGTVRVPDEMAVEGFLATKDVDVMNDDDEDESDNASDGRKSADGQSTTIARNIIPPTFHPPSFGVTVLGNSHGFDKNGSTSGYVLWINGRGIMIDPPPYSSATLEREGIRPQMIMAIIITHCHADHDAGTFQKVMTGSRVAIITTPTIYKSFIRKYAALSGLSPTLLRHSHRHRPAIVGQPLKFQGAAFHFTYTLHTIPCIAFKVEWRGRSIVFTGDHLNSPHMLESLENLVSSIAFDLWKTSVRAQYLQLSSTGCTDEGTRRRSAAVATAGLRRPPSRSRCATNSYPSCCAKGASRTGEETIVCRSHICSSSRLWPSSCPNRNCGNYTVGSNVFSERSAVCAESTCYEWFFHA